MFAAEFVFLYWGLTFTTASRSVIFLYMAPFLVALGAHYLIPGERLTRTRRARPRPRLQRAVPGLRGGAHPAESPRADRRPARGDGGGPVGGHDGAGEAAEPPRRHARSARSSTSSPSPDRSSSCSRSPWASAGSPTRAPVVIGALAYQAVVVAFASYLTWFWLLERYPASAIAALSFCDAALRRAGRRADPGRTPHRLSRRGGGPGRRRHLPGEPPPGLTACPHSLSLPGRGPG